MVTLNTDEIGALSDDDFAHVLADVQAEWVRRETMRNAVAQAENLATRFLNARDGAEYSLPEEIGPGPGGEPWPDEQPQPVVSDYAEWVQPTGAHNAYPERWVVRHAGRLWQSKIPANVWEPGADGPVPTWEDVTPTSSEHVVGAGGSDSSTAAAAWASGVDYTVGVVVTYGGKKYRCLQKHTSLPGWEPTAVPALWAAA